MNWLQKKSQLTNLDSILSQLQSGQVDLQFAISELQRSGGQMWCDELSSKAMTETEPVIVAAIQAFIAAMQCSNQNTDQTENGYNAPETEDLATEEI